MSSLKKILVPTDLSPCSTRALAEAHEFASAFGASIDLLHVWSAPSLVAPESVITGVGIDEQTAVVVQGQRLTVLGENHVHVCFPASRGGTVKVFASGDRIDLDEINQTPSHALEELHRQYHPPAPVNSPR